MTSSPASLTIDPVPGSGTVVAWGANYFNQTNVPAGLSVVVAIAAGVGHLVALKSDGTIVAWGSNEYDETSFASGLSRVASIAAGALQRRHGMKGKNWL